MHRSLSLIALLGLLLSAAAQDGARPLALEEALSLADSRGYQVRLTAAQLAEARGQSLEAWSGILPTASVSTGFVRTTDPVAVFGFKLRQGVFTQNDFSLPALNSPDEFENYTTGIQLQVPLVNLDAIFGKLAANAAGNARRAALERTREVVAFHVTSAYYGLILSSESLTAIEEAIATAEAHRDNARAAFEQGMVSRADVLAAEVRVGELKEQRIVAANQVQTVSDGLKLLLGLSDEPRPLSPTDSLVTPAAKLPGADAPLSARADLRAAGFQLSAARRGRWMAVGSWLPRINGFGSREWHSPDLLGTDADNWTIGVQASWTLFRGFGNLGSAKAAGARVRQMETQYDQALHQAANEVSAARRNVEAARQRIAVARTAMEQAGESLDITSARYREGLEKTADLLDAELTRTRTRLRWLAARHDYAIARHELALALGQ